MMFLGIPANAAKGAKHHRVISNVSHDTSPPLKSIPPILPNGPGQSDGSNSPHASWQMPGSVTTQPDAAVQQLAGPLVAASTGMNFEGIDAPPNNTWLDVDPNGAVGPTQYVGWANPQFAVFNKSTGSMIYGPASGNTIWSGFGGPCETTNQGDGIVQYDKLAGRWIISRHAAPAGGPYFQCVAVSATSDATGQFYRYAFSLVNEYPDYPKLGVWPDAYYLTVDELDPKTFAFVNVSVCALDRNSMLSGAAATAQCFETGPGVHSLLPSDVDGTAPPPAGSPNYLLSLAVNSVNLWTFHVDFANPANSTLNGPTNIPVVSFTPACHATGGICIPQLDTTQKLDAVSDRLMYRLAYRNLGAHESLVVNHTVGAGSFGFRWYEFRVSSGTLKLFQQGTYKPDSSARFMASMAMDKLGDMMVGYSVTSAAMHPAIRYTGRLAADPKGSLQAETSIFEGTGSQQQHDNKWGDYTSISVDPTDDCTFWYTNRYYAVDGTKNWNTRIASFKFASCQ
jgi:hypothetical protein